MPGRKFEISSECTKRLLMSRIAVLVAGIQDDGTPTQRKPTFDRLAVPETHHGDLPLDEEVVDFEP